MYDLGADVVGFLCNTGGEQGRAGAGANDQQIVGRDGG